MTQRDHRPSEAEIRKWCRYFQSTWTPEQEQERAGSGTRIRAVLHEVHVSHFDTNESAPDE